jgi:hypothetical protein
MNDKINILLLVFSVFFLTSCKEKKHLIAVIFYAGFKEDTVLVQYNGKIVFDSIISTNYSIVKAGSVFFEDDLNKMLNIKVNNSICDSIQVTKTFNKIAIEVWNDSIQFSPIIKTIRY